jgi:hypothetical protein
VVIFRPKADAGTDTVYRPPRATGWAEVLNCHFMVSSVVYSLFGLVGLSAESVEGGDESLEQATQNGVSLPANEVYRLRIYRPRVYRPIRSTG